MHTPCNFCFFSFFLFFFYCYFSSRFLLIKKCYEHASTISPSPLVTGTFVHLCLYTLFSMMSRLYSVDGIYVGGGRGAVCTFIINEIDGSVDGSGRWYCLFRSFFNGWGTSWHRVTFRDRENIDAVSIC